MWKWLEWKFWKFSCGTVTLTPKFSTNVFCPASHHVLLKNRILEILKDLQMQYPLSTFRFDIDLKFSSKDFSRELKQWKKDPSLFWCANKKRFKILSRLWRRIGTVKAASAGAERMFSLSGFVLSGRRWNLNPTSVMNVCLQHQWINLFSYLFAQKMLEISIYQRKHV